MTGIDISRERLADLESNLEKSYRIGTDENETELYDIDGLEDCAWEVFAYAGALRDALDAAIRALEARDERVREEAFKLFANNKASRDAAFNAMWSILAEKYDAEVKADAGTRHGITGDVVNSAWYSALAAAIRAQEDNSDE